MKKWIMQLRLLTLAASCCVANPGLADAVNYDEIFAEKALGVLDCASISADGKDVYHEKPVAVFSAPTQTARLPEPQLLNSICIVGGGDCGCAVLYTDRKNVTQGNSFYQVKTRDQQRLWIKAGTDAGTSIKTFAGSVQHPSGNELVVRSQAYDDIAHKHEIDNIFELPGNWTAKIAALQPVQIGYLKLDLQRAGAAASITLRNPMHSEMIVTLQESSDVKKLATWHNDRLQRLGLPLYAKQDGKYLAGYFPLLEIHSEFAGRTMSSPDCEAQSVWWLSAQDIPLEIVPLNSPDENALQFDHSINYVRDEKIDGVEYTVFDVYVDYFDPTQANPDEPAQFKRNHYLLRRIWVKTWKENGTIGYWLNFVPC